MSQKILRWESKQSSEQKLLDIKNDFDVWFSVNFLLGLEQMWWDLILQDAAIMLLWYSS